MPAPCSWNGWTPAAPSSTSPLETAVQVWGGLVRQLSVVPDDRPEWREIDHVAARAEQWSDELPETWEQLAQAVPPLAA